MTGKIADILIIRKLLFFFLIDLPLWLIFLPSSIFLMQCNFFFDPSLFSGDFNVKQPILYTGLVWALPCDSACFPPTMTTTNDHVTVALKEEPYLKVLLFNKVEDKRNWLFDFHF